MRVGNRYRLVNFAEVFEFEVERRLSDYNFRVKDLHTLETYEIRDLIRYGTGKDFDIREIGR